MKIKALTNGPLLVLGPSSVVDSNDRAYPNEHPATFALCRCGGSSTKPFCDGSHARNGFVCPPQPD